ncbi:MULTISPECIES: GntR family transcriptional regulator [unclassified Micromonospora]|uniref:GntR family transcriptional regulator n=1 Tax=unclassified Micromonospora TaxID=2617518 RepID=UPI002FF3128D
MPTPHYGKPRYRLIADKIRERIESGDIPPGSLLPAESALTAEFRAARGTIRQAIALLREAGLVTTEHGRGTYAHARRHPRGQDQAAEPETRQRQRQRQVAADRELAALFAVEVGTTLIEDEEIVWTDGTVGEVVRIYRLLGLGSSS